MHAGAVPFRSLPKDGEAGGPSYWESPLGPYPLPLPCRATRLIESLVQAGEGWKCRTKTAVGNDGCLGSAVFLPERAKPPGCEPSVPPDLTSERMFCRIPSTSVLISEVEVSRSAERPLNVDEAADRLEQALSGLSLPIRIQGGRVREGGVRYVVTPMNGTRAEQLQDAEALIARALGVQQVHVARDGDDLAIEVPGEPVDWPRLLSILEDIGDRRSLSLAAGLDERGRVVLIPLRQPDTWHVAVLGGAGVGKSELMRSLVLSVALTHRQSMVQLFGIDIGGRELTVLEAVPHGLTDVATEPRFAAELMTWLMEEGARRERYSILRPDFILAVDDTSRLIEADRSAAGQLRQIAHQGRRWGIHLLLADRPSTDPASRPWDHTPGWAIVNGGEGKGKFALTAGIRALPFTAAWLTASDLNLAVRQMRIGRRPRRADLFYSISRKELSG
jgi:hypothetical protein